MSSNKIYQNFSGKKKISRGEILSKCSSKKMYSNYDDQLISNKAEERKSEIRKDFTVEEPLTTNFMVEESYTYPTKVDDQKIGSYADVLAKTEKIWSQNKLALEKKLCSLPSEHTFAKLDALEKETEQELERNLKTNSPPKKTNVGEHSMLWESAVWENFNSSPKDESRYSTDNLLTETKSLKSADEPKKDKMFHDLNGGLTKDKDSKLSAEYVSLGNLKFLDKLLDDDSAYGSDESLPRSSPEPADLETASNTSTCNDTLENYAELAKSDSETKLNSNKLESIHFNETFSNLCLDQDTECISEGSDCDMYHTGEFREFLMGLNSTKPRQVVHEDKECLICQNKIVNESSLLSRFGLLLNCEHPFCYNCISSACYRKYYPVSVFEVKCPVCSAFSPGIVSSPRWIKSKIKKVNLFKKQKMAYMEELILKLYFNGVFFKMSRRGNISSSSKFTLKSHDSRKHS